MPNALEHEEHPLKIVKFLDLENFITEAFLVVRGELAYGIYMTTLPFSPEDQR